MVTHLPSLPSTQSRTWSMAALAAEAADDRPRASMIAAPRLPTLGMNSLKFQSASAANAAIDHIRDWVLGSNGDWVTMGVPSDGSYGIPEGVIYGVPVTTANGAYTRVEGLPIDDFSRERMDKTLAELEEERAGVAHLL